MTGLRWPKTKLLPLALGAGACALGIGLRAALRKSPKDLRGQVVLITGGSRGLGLALAEELLDEGCRVALAARSSAELEAAQAQLRAKNPDAEVATFVQDITAQGAAEELIAAVTSRFGRIDILVNNAGLIEVAPVDALRFEDFERAMDLMFFAHLRMILAALPQMTQRRSGVIVNISSIGGRISVPRLLPYCAAKFALTGLSEGLAVELRQKNVRVLTVIPGLMRTGSHLKAEFKGNAKKEYDWFALGATSPLVATSAGAAAHRIVTALQTQEDECVISLPAQALSLIHGTAPSLTRDILRFADKYVLPDPSASQEILKGHECDRDKGVVFRALTSLGRMAAKELNEEVETS